MDARILATVAALSLCSCATSQPQRVAKVLVSRTVSTDGTTEVITVGNRVVLVREGTPQVFKAAAFDMPAVYALSTVDSMVNARTNFTNALSRMNCGTAWKTDVIPKKYRAGPLGQWKNASHTSACGRIEIVSKGRIVFQEVGVRQNPIRWKATF